MLKSPRYQLNIVISVLVVSFLPDNKTYNILSFDPLFLENMWGSWQFRIIHFAFNDGEMLAGLVEIAT